MGIGSPYVQYQVIAPQSDVQGQWHTFVVDDRDVQIDWASVVPGQIVHIALKSDVRPGVRRSGTKRLIAPYGRKVIVSPEVCTTCAHDSDAEDQTICRNCIESWCWDWFVRYEPKWDGHGTLRSYQYYGCRCPECRYAQQKYQSVRLGKDVHIRGNGRVRGHAHTSTTVARNV